MLLPFNISGYLEVAHDHKQQYKWNYFSVDFLSNANSLGRSQLGVTATLKACLGQQEAYESAFIALQSGQKGQKFSAFSCQDRKNSTVLQQGQNRPLPLQKESYLYLNNNYSGHRCRLVMCAQRIFQVEVAEILYFRYFGNIFILSKRIQQSFFFD